MKLKTAIRRLPAAKRTIVARFVREGYMDDDAEMGDGGDHKQAMRGGFEAACLALIKKMLDGSLDATAGLKKLKDMVVAHGKLSDDDEDDLDEEGDDEEEPADKEKKADEAFLARLQGGKPLREQKGRGKSKLTDDQFLSRITR